jgi:hypothetical protein
LLKVVPVFMILIVMTALSVLFLSSLTISSCDLCKTVLGGLRLWVIYNSFEFVADLKERNKHRLTQCFSILFPQWTTFTLNLFLVDPHNHLMKKLILFFTNNQVWTQKCAVQKASVDVNISYY